MGMDIFRRENWDRWACGPYHKMDFRLDAEKDRWLLQYLLSHCARTQRVKEMARLGLDEVPAPPVNIDDPRDRDYAPYIMLREQVMREDDCRTLRAAMLDAPNAMMRRFAFCRLTGYSWPFVECDAYSYRTWDCGLKSEATRESIEVLCRELADANGPFARQAAQWLERLPKLSDDALAQRASGKTERRYDDDPKG